ncbi:uroporphyrinogen decarboxylase [Ostreibacterium oceani]|uniref:Uroporphyrinogen decarboxylase n=1 Tax=Ostreibacterium oceani TaxID=2654998 RepID=A0A6N7EVR1_9GAMM|nr:uroporphyrinogen decarboxylase [Ostreibacterium oceani]MPV86854.1 uroporphyrinogen decarboxylase [Ostreibacterium oceani]
MPPLQNDRLIRALLRQPVDRTPIWVMRQAGRYLPEYRQLRAQAGSFMALCQNPELACEVTLQPLARFDLDAAILFSDILTIPDAMGLGLYFSPNEGPMFERTITCEKDLLQLKPIDPNQDLRYVMDAVSTIRRALQNRIPLIGFAGSPWTLATYMIDGGGASKKGFPKAQTMLYSNPKLLHALLDKLVDAVSDYLVAQIEAGAQALMIFDTWGGLLTPAAYETFSQQKMAEIVARLPKNHDGQRIPVVLFTKGGMRNLPGFVAAGTDAIGLDWTADLSDAKAIVGNQLALQGNLNPNILLSSSETIETEVKKVLASYGNVHSGQGHVFNLGHGITPDVPPENMAALIEAVKQHSPQYHQTN